MKKIKILLLALFVIILTGCKGEYNLEFKDDSSLKEEINFSIENKDNAYEKTIKLFESNEIDDSMYSVSQNDEYVNIHYEEEFNSLEDYVLHSKFYSRLFKDENIIKNNKGIYYKGKANLKLNDNTSNSNLNESFYIDDLKINVKIPFVIKDNNADSVKDDTLTWVLNDSDTFKKINFSFNYLKSNNLYIIVIALCSGIVLVSAFIFIRNYFKEKGI